MADIKTPEERSRNMSRIRSRDTRPEEYIRRELFARGYRYRKNYSGIVGHPDLWLAKYNTAVFVNGCFWHRHKDCRYAYMPKSRMKFWTAKFTRNIERDRIVKQELIEQRIRMLTIWECTVKRMMRDGAVSRQLFNSIEEFLVSTEDSLEL